MTPAPAAKPAAPSPLRVALVDTGANVVYSLVIGAFLDALAGLPLLGIVVARAYAAAMNAATGGPYGWWRDRVFFLTRTGAKAGTGPRLRRALVDLLAFNTFQVPLYATAVAVGCLASEGTVDWGKVRGGALYLAAVSPFIGPTMGWTMDLARRLFGVPTAAARAADQTGQQRS